MQAIQANSTRLTLTPALRCQLQGIFRDDIEKTQALIERDLSFWLAGDCS